MSSFEKLILRIKKCDRSLRPDEIDKVLVKCGYTGRFPRSGSSHKTYRKKGCCPITIPQHRPIDPVYIDLIRSIIEEEEEQHGSERS